MRCKNGFREASGLKERKAEQHGISRAGPDCALNVAGHGNGFHQHGVNRHADHNQKALESERKQGFQVVLPDLAPLAVGEGGKRNRADGDEKVNFQHPPVNDEEDAERHDFDGEPDQQGLNPEAEQGGKLHRLELVLKVARDGRDVDVRVPADDARAAVDHMLCQVEYRQRDVERMRDEKNGDNRFGDPLKENGDFDVQHVLSRILYKKRDGLSVHLFFA